MPAALVVIGGGAAGLAAARGGADKARTTLVTSAELGGDCTWTGCVPSKTLLEQGRRGLDFAAAMAHLESGRARIAGMEDAATLEREGVRVLRGAASFLSATEVEVTADDGSSRRLQADRVVIATGAGPVVPPIPGLREGPHLTNENVFTLSELPRSLVVLGGGAIGCELASAFARFGTDVTVLEAAPRILAKEEPEAADVVRDAMRAEGVTVLEGVTATAVSHGPDGVTVTTESDGAEGTVRAERILVAVGRTPFTEGLGLDRAGVSTSDRGFVTTDDTLRTDVSSIYAAGDVTGRLQFTHAADAMGRLAARNALGRRSSAYSTRATPWVTFTDPEVARVGLSEAEAAEQVPGARVAFLPLSEFDRAIVAGRTEGFVKLVVGPRRLLRNVGGGRVLGATVVAPRAGEMIAEVALAMHLDAFAGRLAQATHAYPTWGMAVQIAAVQLFDEFAGRRARPARAGGSAS